MGVFMHSCSLPSPWLRGTFTWTCRCGRSWEIAPHVADYAEGRSTHAATPTGKSKRRK